MRSDILYICVCARARNGSKPVCVELVKGKCIKKLNERREMGELVTRLAGWFE